MKFSRLSPASIATRLSFVACVVKWLDFVAMAIESRVKMIILIRNPAPEAVKAGKSR